MQSKWHHRAINGDISVLTPCFCGCTLSTAVIELHFLENILIQVSFHKDKHFLVSWERVDMHNQAVSFGIKKT